MMNFSEAFERGYWHISFFQKESLMCCVMSSLDVKQVSLFGEGETADGAYQDALGNAPKRRRRDVEDLA